MFIGGFEPFSASDFPGQLAAVVFAQGCNFRCPFCHNHSLLAPVTSSAESCDKIFTFLQRRQGLLGGVVISGGEPCLQPGLAAFCERLKDMGFQVKLDTNGSRPRVVKELIGARLLDYIAMDIKAPLGRYDELAGCAGAARYIEESIAIIAGSGLPHHFRTTHVSSLLEEHDLAAIRALVPSGSVHRLQPFRPENALDAQLRLPA